VKDEHKSQRAAREGARKVPRVTSRVATLIYTEWCVRLESLYMQKVDSGSGTFFGTGRSVVGVVKHVCSRPSAKNASRGNPVEPLVSSSSRVQWCGKREA
jgi:hypothetical protein